MKAMSRLIIKMLLIVIVFCGSVQTRADVGGCLNEAGLAFPENPTPNCPPAQTVKLLSAPGMAEVTVSGGAIYGWPTGWVYQGGYASYMGSQQCGMSPQIDISFSKSVSNVAIKIRGGSNNSNTYVTLVNNKGETSEQPLQYHDWFYPGYIGFRSGGIRHIRVTIHDPGWQWEIGTISYTTEACSTPSPTPIPTPASASDDTFVPTNPYPAPTPTDTTFVRKVTDVGYFLPRNAEKKNLLRDDGPIRVSVDVERAIGEVNVDGTLKYPQELIDNGVVSGIAKLRLAVYDVDFDAVDPVYFQEMDHITFNGVEIGPQLTPFFLKGKNREWIVNEFDIPISLIHFGKMNPEGDSPIKGYNEIKIQIDEANSSSNKNRWGVNVAWASIQISALAPVVMIHGNSSCGNFFAGDVQTPCQGSDGDRMPEGVRFVQGFKDKKIPFDNSINMTPNDSIDRHANYLATKIPEVAKRFGAKHVHIIAHSKGGLDTRKFLTLIKPDTLGVYSLTTLSTPHEGSPGADYQLDARAAFRENLNSSSMLAPGVVEALVDTTTASDNPLRAALSLAAPPNAGTPYLRVDAVRAFNEENKLLLPKSFKVDGETNKIFYYAISADANLDDSHIGGDIPWQPTISVNETEWVPPIRATLPGTELLVGWSKEQLYLQVYMLLGTVKSTSIKMAPMFPGTQYGVAEDLNEIATLPDGTPYIKFTRNDFAVSRRSAAIYPKEQLGFDSWWEVKANHATISSKETANMVISGIKLAQPLQ